MTWIMFDYDPPINSSMGFMELRDAKMSEDVYINNWPASQPRPALGSLEPECLHDQEAPSANSLACSYFRTHSGVPCSLHMYERR